jgi:hypothetical protein
MKRCVGMHLDKKPEDLNGDDVKNLSMSFKSSIEVLTKNKSTADEVSSDLLGI